MEKMEKEREDQQEVAGFQKRRLLLLQHKTQKHTFSLRQQLVLTIFLNVYHFVFEGNSKARKGSRGFDGVHSELRYNLATKVMSNGVEVIVATDRSARPLEPEFLRFLSSTVTRPITLAPHTLTNLMSMVLSSEQVVDDENRFLALLRPTFTKRTLYTLYNYKTTGIRNSTAVATNVKTLVKNIRTEPVFGTGGAGDIKTVSYTIDASPTLQTQVFSTEYTYYNTIVDGDQPLVVSSTQTVSNTLIGTIEDFKQLEPSEVFPTTNTYYKTVELTKTLTDGTDRHITSTYDTVTQVVVTDKRSRKATQTAITTNVTKTYFVTYTYFSTYVEGDKTKVKSDVSVSSDVTIEKFYIKPKKTETVTFEKVTRTDSPVKRSSVMFPINILATKTYLTTFTYYTTLLQGMSTAQAETKISSRTKVVENVVTETLSQQDLNVDYLMKLNSSLQRISGSIIATATLKQGDTVLITAYKNSPIKNSYENFQIKATKTNSDMELRTKTNEVFESQEKFAEMESGIKSSLSVPKSKITLIKPSKTFLGSQPVAEALIAAEENDEILKITPTSTLGPSSLTRQEISATGVTNFDNLMPTASSSSSGSTQKTKENIRQPEQPSKKDENAKQPFNQTNVGGLLNLNVLGPVFNVMADLINNKINKNSDSVSRRNETVTETEHEQNVKQPSSNNVNPLLNFVNKLTSATTKVTQVGPKAKPTSPRTPVYIPVGSVGEESSEVSENQNRRVLIANGPDNWYDKWKDIHDKNFDKIRPQENPVILEGGIPISPGQVITTNSDVIIGRPGESGPRPPNFAIQNNLPVDMKPPPVGASVIVSADGDHYVGQHSTNQGVNIHYIKDDININPPPPITPPKLIHEGQNLKNGRPFANEHRVKGVPPPNGGHKGLPPPNERHKILSQLNDRHKGGPPLKNPHFKKNPSLKYDSGTMDLNPPPVPPPPVRTHDVHRPITVNHKPVHESHEHDIHDVRGVHDGHDDHEDHDVHDIHSIPLQLAENHHIENYVSSSNINPSVLTLPTVPAINQIHTGGIPLISTPTPNLEAVNLQSVVLVPTVGDISINPNVVDRSTGHPFLVNIQPSQVANVVIPHGSSTALIVNDKQHSLKGEVIDDPSPHPGRETVGFIGAEPVLKLPTDDITSALNNEVTPPQTENASGANLHQQLFGDAHVNNQQQQQGHSQNAYLNLGQTTQFTQQLPGIVQEGSSTFLGNHQANVQHQEEPVPVFGQQNANLQIQSTGGVPINHNINVNAQNYVKGSTQPDANDNYRRKPNLNIDESDQNDNVQNTLNSQHAIGGNYFQQIQGSHGQQQYPLDTTDLYKEQIRFKQGQNIENGGSTGGVYLAVPPPPSSAPTLSLPEVVHFHEAQSSNSQQSTLHESLVNHQSGIVHDVPIAQILAGSDHDHKEGHNLKDIHGTHIENNKNLVSPDVNLGSLFYEGQNLAKRPANDFEQDLSPPPLPHKPTFGPVHPGSSHQNAVSTQPKSPQRHRPHPHQPVPTPLEFMIPPPEAPNRLKIKTQPEPYPRPVIPIGAVAPQQIFGHPRPEDMVIVPPKNRPGFVEASFVNNIKNKHQIPPNANVYYDLDVSDSSGNYKTENGEEMQESVVQPMFPGKVINDVLHYNANFTRPNVHQHIGPPKPLEINEITRNYTSDGETGGKNSAIVGPTTSSKTDVKNRGTDPSHQGSTNNRKTVATADVGTKPQEVANHPLDFINDSLKLGTSSTGQVAPVDATRNGNQNLNNHKGYYGFHNHREQSERPVNHNQATSTDLFQTSGLRGPTGSDSSKTAGTQNIATGFGSNRHNKTQTSTTAHGKKSNQAGYGSNENSHNIRRPSSGTTNHNDLSNSESAKDPVSLFNDDKSNIEPVGHSSIKIETISKDAFFGLKDTTSDTNRNHNKKPHEPPSRNRINELHRDHSEGYTHSDPFSNHAKPQPGRYGSSNQPYGTKLQPGGSGPNFTRPAHGQEGQNKNPQTSATKHRIRIPTGGHNAHISGHNNAGSVSQVQKRPYLPFDSLGQGSTKIRRPVGFTRPSVDAENANKILEEEANRGSTRVVTTDAKKASNESGNTKGFIASDNGPRVPTNRTQASSFNLGSNQNYENKTINFYDSKPTFDVSKVHKTYNKAALETGSWFGGNLNNKNNHKYNVSKSNLAQIGSQENTTLTADASDLQITLMSPPKLPSDTKTKLEEVMGLSPPPLERPRRPPTLHRPQRPKPHFKFEIPSTQKPPLPPSLAMENDFPPVRSPDFNRKPFKPQDIFPPRLPDNFVHHLPDYPIRVPSKPRLPERPEKPVTSLPIDVPTTNKSEKPSHIFNAGVDLEESTGEDPYFAGSEINGHSKPIHGDINAVSVKRPPPSVFSSSTKHKSVFQTKTSSASTHQQTSKVRTSERPRPSSTTPQIKQTVVKSTKRDDISPTPVISIPTTKTYHTKTGTLVTPTTTQPYKEWQDADVITGSETTFESNQFSSHVTPTITDIGYKKEIDTRTPTPGSPTKFEDSSAEVLKKKSSATTSLSVPEEDAGFDLSSDRTPMVATPVVVPTRTTTLTVTTTMTTVVKTGGHKPFTTTIVLTKTLISTVINKVTETKTLLKPTTSTLTQTHTVSRTQTASVVPTALYPSQTKYHSGGTLKPEIFVADPHAKDTMTISVSSSMNKNGDNDGQEDEYLDQTDNESIMVVVSNKHPQEDASDEDKIEVSDEETDVIHSRVMVGGVFDASVDKEFQESNSKTDECFPGCKAKKNELCQRIKGALKCVCRPGFARMFPDRPCRPTYTYKVKLALDKLGPEEISYEKNVAKSNSADMAKLTSVTKEGLDRMIMQSELRDIYHGVVLNGFQEGKEQKTTVDFYVQLSENRDEDKLMDIFKQTLQTSNYSLGGTELFAAREADNLDAEDFNECLNPKFHDCSENARCFNLKGTYTCSCKEGYTDMSENAFFPGRVCSDAIGCEYCGYHGACYPRGDGQITCECFQWYSGERCNINLKVLLIALATIGVVLLALLLVCGVLTCLNRRNRNSSSSRNNGYLRYRGPSSHSIDRRAMISDTSSESSIENVPYLSSPPLGKASTMSGKKKAVLRQVKGPLPRTLPPPGVEQRDRSVTVMIPRAKYRPPPHLSSHLTMSTFSPEKHLPKPVGPIATEQKLINYLDGNTREDRTLVNTKSHSNRQDSTDQHKTYDFKSLTSTNIGDLPRTLDKKKDSRTFEYEYKMSNMTFSEETNSAERRAAKSGNDDRFRRHSDSTHLHSDSNRAPQFRKYSAGALVSAGYEVSAKVGMHQLDDDVTEDDQSGILNTHTMKSNRSQFTTLNRTGDHKTMSEARSYDETTVHPQTRSLKTNYSGSSPSSRANNDEGHTMIERDLGSTFVMPESQLFKPEADRESDISNFDSL